MMMNISTAMIMMLCSAVASTLTHSCEMLPEFILKSNHDLFNLTSECDLDNVTLDDDLHIFKPDSDIGTVLSDRDFDHVNSDYDLDIVNSDRDLAIVLGIHDSELIQDIDQEGTSDLDIESKHDERTETDVNIYTERMNSRDPPNHSNSHTAIEDVAKYPGTGLFYTHADIDRLNKEMGTFTDGDNDNCCPTVTKFRITDTTMVNTRNQTKTMAKLPNSTQAYPYVENCNPQPRHGRRGRCKKCEPQYVTLFLLVEPDADHTERYFDKFPIPMYCTCKSLICK